jgi:hypothetical protein
VFEQFLHELDVPRRYALAFIPAGSFTLVTDPDQARQSLRRLRDAVLPGGTMLLETGQHRPA